MADVAELRKKIDERNKVVNKCYDEYLVIKQEVDVMRNEFAVLICPYRIGQIMISKSLKAQIIKIESISYEPYYSLWGMYLKKNGIAGKIHHRLYDHENWRPE